VAQLRHRGDAMNIDGIDQLAEPADSPVLAELRATCPVSRTPNGAWFLARNADVLAATKDVHTFRASFREPGVVVPDEEQLINEIPEPRHGEVRKVINSAIAAHKITRMEGFCRELSNELLDDLLGREGVIDLVHDYVMPIPNNVIAELLGAKREDFNKWAAWSDEVVQGSWPTQNRNERGEGLAGAHPEFTAYVDELIRERKESPKDDFITRLINTEIDGRRLTDIETRTQLVFLFISGNETTRHLISNLLLRIVNNPTIERALRENSDLINNAIEESLRYDPPVKLLMRNCEQETQVHGETMCPRDKVAFGILSANRDENLYDEPHEFRLDRPSPRNHLGLAEVRMCVRVLLSRDLKHEWP
jgi:cholest-4-en-3-one 26-monooxygenase